MSEESDRRIDAARVDAERKRQTKEFMEGLTKSDKLLNPIYNPEAFLMREKFRGAARRGEFPKTSCRHPLNLLQQYVDEDPGVKRNGRPVNLFECGVCHQPLWLVDAFGSDVTDD